MAEITGSGDFGEYMEGGNNQYVIEGEGGDAGEGNDGTDQPHESEPLREQDRFLPIANVHRIMKKNIPKSGKIAKDAKECVQECVSEFISFITSEASERCHQEKRKTINGEDILFAMSTLGFDNYVEPLKMYLQKYRETLHQTNTKVEKALQESAMEQFTSEDEAAFATSLTSGSLITDQQNPGVIYTTYPGTGGQLTTQTINFG